MELRERRIVARFVRIGLVGLAVLFVYAFFRDRDGDRVRPRVEMDAAPAVVAGSADAELFNEDSTVTVFLVGDRISAGLSPKMVEKIRDEMARSAAKETSGLGATIARAVTEQVADKIDTRVSWDVHDIRDLRYEDGRIIVTWRSGEERDLFGNVKVDGERGNRFREADAQRFIAAVRARQRRR